MEEKPLSEVFSDWANIPDDVLHIIALKSHSVKDFIVVTAVCRSWYISFKHEYHKLPPICLMYGDEENSSDIRYLPKIMVKHKFPKVYLYDEKIVKLELPEVRGRRRCWESSFGWMLTHAPPDADVQLFNPLSRTSLSLPSLTTLPFLSYDLRSGELDPYFIKKLILLSSPTSAANCIVMIIYSDEHLLAFAKPGDETWTFIIGMIEDVTYFNGEIYGFGSSGHLVSIQLASSQVKVTLFSDGCLFFPFRQKHMVDLGNYLCMVVHRHVEDGFEVFKFDMERDNWEKIFYLRNRSLFIGNCSSFSVLPVDFPGCRPNCIYYCDENDVWIEKRGDGKRLKRLTESVDKPYGSSFSSPFWIKFGSK